MSVTKSSKSNSKGSTSSRNRNRSKSQQAASQKSDTKRLTDEEKIEEAFKTLDRFKNKSHNLAQVIASGSQNLLPSMNVQLGPQSSSALDAGEKVLVQSEAKGHIPQPPFYVLANTLLNQNSRFATALNKLDDAATKTFGELYKSPNVPEFLKGFSEYYENHTGEKKGPVAVHEILQKHIHANENLANMLIEVSYQIESLS